VGALRWGVWGKNEEKNPEKQHREYNYANEFSMIFRMLEKCAAKPNGKCEEFCGELLEILRRFSISSLIRQFSSFISTQKI
jgi:hypothetical protein